MKISDDAMAREDTSGLTRSWDDLSGEEQTALLIEYGRYLDTLASTCSPEERERRLARWLADRGIAFPARR